MIQTPPLAKQRWLGADTHADFHVLAVIDGDGRQIDSHQFDTTATGITAATDWAFAFDLSGAGVEGSSSYGATLTAALLAAGIPVVEVTRPNRQDRRNHGKSDQIDAIQAAQAVRTGQRIAPVKSHPLLHELRAHYVLRDSALKQRTEVGNQLQALAKIMGIPHGPQSKTLMHHLAQYPELTAATNRWLALDTEAKEGEKALARWLRRYAPEILQPLGAGPISASQLVLASGLNPQRTISEAGFARLCGLSPIPASSGRNQRHRLDRGGDRTANQAFWRIAFIRSSTDQRTKDYITKRLDDHRDTHAGALRNLKRHIAREITPILHTISCRMALQTT